MGCTRAGSQLPRRLAFGPSNLNFAQLITVALSRPIPASLNHGPLAQPLQRLILCQTTLMVHFVSTCSATDVLKGPCTPPPTHTRRE